MEHPFFPTTTTRAEALRWLTIAEKLLSTRDLMGSKSFATRARDSDPTLTHADLILAVADTLLAGDRRVGNNQQDWYAILRLSPQQGRDGDLIAAQYRNLAVLLNPQTNNFAFAEQAFRLVVDAWGVLSNPTRKALYDKELNFYLYSSQQQQPDPFSNPFPAMHQNFMFFGGSTSGGGTPHPPQGGVHFAQMQQVHTVSPQVDPVGSGSTREPQNFMGFNPGSNPFFGSGSGSGSRSSHEMFSKHAQENYPTLVGNVGSAPGSTREQVEQVNNRHDHDQPQQDYSSIGDKISHNVNVSVNVEEEIEDVEDVDEMEEEEEEEEERVDEPENDDGSAFWTACPYCYYMYEYPSMYVDCTLRCQKCKSAFQAVAIPSPPPVVDGQDVYFCCWGFLPFGFSKTVWQRSYGRRKSSTPRVYIDDDDVFVDISDSSESDDDDWDKGSERRKKKVKNVRGKGNSGTTTRSAKKAQIDHKVKNVNVNVNVNVQDGNLPPHEVETPTPTPNPNKIMGGSIKTGPGFSARKQPARVAKSFGKLDLNVECSNEGEEPTQRVIQGNGANRGEDDNIEGIGFFEGLDEFLNSLPILNVVGDDKVVKAA
ncbi:hypothetical protein BUALT_Bualt19G0097500 [Buddleja alternifolia]|uniref:J domain-containing protein n=1 Tax=Buddleja alternifolia TaxID=168488 RepID=A0AAV6WB20_9LAMI|nr:hypothetical protein BUALT_Bualt19G0097500 [Buddleja alternifolia]